MRAALNPASPLARLMAAPVRPGRLTWIGTRPARRGAMQVLEEVALEAGQGLVGDRYHTRTNGGRQASLIQAEDLRAIASYLGRDDVAPIDLRRNLVTAGINLLALKDRRFRIGPALLEWSGECHPCTRMEETFGPGGYNAVRGHGGILARVIEGGTIRLGDAVERVDP